MIESRYPDFDVMARSEEWDEHTRSVIANRMKDPGQPRFLTEAESATLRAAAARLLAETDPWLIGKVVEHIDTLLAQGPGDGYRKESVPPDQAHWRCGLALLGEGFATQEPWWQDERLRTVSETEPDFFGTLLKECVSAYCSLPPVWSFMGYGGPAYPRGYVRIELGLVDPWEAKQRGE